MAILCTPYAESPDLIIKFNSNFTRSGHIYLPFRPNLSADFSQFLLSHRNVSFILQTDDFFTLEVPSDQNFCAHLIKSLIAIKSGHTADLEIVSRRADENRGRSG